MSVRIVGLVFVGIAGYVGFATLLEANAYRSILPIGRRARARAAIDEGLHAQLMRVLTLSGRRSDAMATYRELRARLTEELGVEPSGELQALHHDLLCAGEPR